MQINYQDTINYQFTNYSDGIVTIAGQSFNKNIMVFNNQILDFRDCNIKQINMEDLSLIIEYQPDLIIFGVKNKIIYPDLKVVKNLHYQNIGVETMLIPALCRTFNFLIGENRKVACILLFC